MDVLDFEKYNAYIWASYALTFIVLAWNVVTPILAKKKLIKDIKRRNYLASNGSNETKSKNLNEST